MITIWDNPEWIRHRRAILRPATMMTIISISWILCALIAYATGIKPMTNIVIGAHMFVLPLWVAATCGKSILRERTLQTFDFWRTTRLTPQELIAGQLCGVPLRGILAAASTLPIALLSLAFDVNPVAFALEYLMLLLFCVTVGLGGLAISMDASPFQGSRGFTWLFGIFFAIVAIPFVAGAGVGTGLWVMTPYPFLDMLGYGSGTVNVLLFQSTALFGVMPVSNVLLGMILNLSFSGWFFLMLSRNIKKDQDEIRLFSRWQAIGFAMFLTLLLHAFGLSSQPKQVPSATTLEQSLYLMNILTLYLIGIIMLTPTERLRIWWHHWSSGHASYLHEDGFPWPWVVVTTICLSGMTLLSAIIGGWFSPALLWNLGLVAVFVIRDVTFLQWCLGLNVKRPLFTGLLYLGLYYFVTQAVTAQAPGIHSLLTPLATDDLQATNPIVTLVIQGLIAGALLHRLTKQLKEPVRSIMPSNSEQSHPSTSIKSSPPQQ